MASRTSTPRRYQQHRIKRSESFIVCGSSGKFSILESSLQSIAARTCRVPIAVVEGFEYFCHSSTKKQKQTEWAFCLVTRHDADTAAAGENHCHQFLGTYQPISPDTLLSHGLCMCVYIPCLWVMDTNVVLWLPGSYRFIDSEVPVSSHGASDKHF